VNTARLTDAPDQPEVAHAGGDAALVGMTAVTTVGGDRDHAMTRNGVIA
jgi:hypothetical protein